MAANPTSPSGAFILGAARSGTSLFYKAMCLHPDTTYISNWMRRVPSANWLGVLNRAPRRWPHLQQAAWFAGGSEGYTYGQSRSLVQRLAPQPVEGEPVFAHCGFRQYDWEPKGTSAQQAQRLSRTFAGLRKSAGARTVVSKRIAHNRRVTELHDALPDARFIALTRDGRAVAASLAAVDWWKDDVLWWNGKTPRVLEAAGEDPWELCARNWVADSEALETSLAPIPSSQVLRLRYEDFVADAVTTVTEAAHFLGLPVDTAWIEAVERLNTPNRNDSWRSLPSDVIERIQTIEYDLLRRYGYLD